ncbi:glutathionylspermidine synthase family protein [Tellurirhabdus rosea]|uniref:glutathionylspermidine synthase family protein n=1 Tax=Tellurirhabdus rosea TaxID=2674997 RepID=UPI00225ACCD8|nr:glutathionylspermidine synthase family protein [Tellurirhabdus rosea]
MIHLKNLPTSPDQQLRNIGWDWMLGTDTLPYLTSQVVPVKAHEAEAYNEAANQLFNMFVEAGQHVIDRNLFRELEIPDNLVELIKLSWNDDRHIQLYGRFDFAGGLDGDPIKLIEFNADTATCIPETAVVQYAQLRANGLAEGLQYNALYESLIEQFRELKRQNSDLQPTLLLSAMRGFPEDDANVAVLGEAAREAGFTVDFEYIDQVEFSAEEGIFKHSLQTSRFEKFDFWFKLIPWEYIGYEEPDLTRMLTEMVRRRQVVILNPAYSLLFQSKYILKVLWDLYPYHPLLLKTDTRRLTDRPSVEKVLFGREGANVRILDEAGRAIQEVPGDYGDYTRIYQEYVEFPKDASGQYYQAGVFFAGEGCGLGFRRGGVVIDNGAQFVGHLIE